MRYISYRHEFSSLHGIHHSSRMAFPYAVAVILFGPTSADGVRCVAQRALSCVYTRRNGYFLAGRKECKERNHREKIIGGDDAPKGRYPYMCALYNRGFKFACGGFLIHSKWVLTAAHCVDPNDIRAAYNAPVLCGVQNIGAFDPGKVSTHKMFGIPVIAFCRLGVCSDYHAHTSQV